MRILTLKLGDKTYRTGKITTYLSKEALKIQKEALALAKQGQALLAQGEATPDLEAVDSLLSALVELKERKTWLICEVYGNQFTADDLEKALSDEEIDAQVNAIIASIAGVISKN